MSQATRARVESFEERFAVVNGVRLHFASAGPPEGRLVVLLHGFPEFWWSWRHQLEALATAGYRVLAPDMRGFAQSDKPAGVRSYGVELLAKDVAELVRREGRASAIVVGHDWGAVVAWQVAMRHPEIVERLGVLNVPHPRRMLEGLLTREQLRKSWYIFFFQIPGLPERLISRNDFANLRAMFREDGFDEEEIDPYVDALRYPGALTAALNYYRAAARDTLSELLARGRGVARGRRVTCPVLVLWGRRDRVLGAELAAPPPDLVPNATVEVVEHASHWLQRDAPDLVNARLLRFFEES
ncbi:MAG: alpha/beta hydrolase [Myxococcales bacterium]|nr:alpha/beta hydrolase [Myxococcales bacterium]HQY60801.1 alpha/beta hydrolase [Polyangiaceae bacterium]